MLSSMEIIQINICGITFRSKHMNVSPSRSLTDQGKWTQNEGVPSIKIRETVPLKTEIIAVDRLRVDEAGIHYPSNDLSEWF